MRRWICALLLAGCALPTLAAWDLAQLMDDLARLKVGRARFVETKYLALLDKPIVATGEMSFRSPDRLEKRTLTPRAETLLLERDRLSIERDQQKLSINLASQPEALALVDSMRAALTGNRQALEKHYALHLAGRRENWTLTLLPSDQALAAIVQRIRISGQDNRIRSIETLQADGDRTVLSLEPLAAQ